MSKHRMPKERRARLTLVAAATAASISSTLVLGHAINITAEHFDVGLANTVIGIGGRGDSLSANVPNKLSGNIAPADWNGSFVYQGIEYPADLNFQASIDDGAPKLANAIANPVSPGPVRVTAYSEGTLVAEQVKRDLADAVNPPAPDQLSFLLIASPYVPNGGLFARFPGFRIPGLLPEFGPAAPSAYDETYVTHEYDPYADFPAYFNPLSLANSALAVMYAHPDQYYDDMTIDFENPNPDVYDTKTVGNTTYVFVYNPQLPLFAPLRQLGSITALTPLTEPLIGAFEPLARLFVDMGYTDRVNANPETPTPFSFITPPAKIVEALVGVPGALAQGAGNLLSGGVPALPLNTLKTPEPTTAETGNQRLALASVPEPKVETEKPAAPEVAKKDLDDKDPEEKDPEKKDAEQITHPTVTSDGNKVAPTTTAGGTTTGNQPPVETTPTTNPAVAEEDPTTKPPTAAPQAPAPSTVDAKDEPSQQATDDAAA